MTAYASLKNVSKKGSSSAFSVPNFTQNRQMEKQEGKEKQLSFRRAKGNNTEKEYFGFLFCFIYCVCKLKSSFIFVTEDSICTRNSVLLFHTGFFLPLISK